MVTPSVLIWATSPVQTIDYPKTLALMSTFPVWAVAESGVAVMDKVTTETFPLYFPDGRAAKLANKAVLCKVPLTPSMVTVMVS
jgi:hypothetical protein